jgi:hypothetical protein
MGDMEESENPELFNAHFDELFNEVSHILSFSERRETEVLSFFGANSVVATGVNAKYKEPTTNTVFSEEKIKALSIRHRLRFLSSKLYCGEIPYEVIACMKAFEHRFPNSDLEFHILAPAEFFLLKNAYASPLLFVKKRDGEYKLLCQWGDKLPWYIPILRYPMRDYKSMIVSSVFFGILMAISAALAGWMNYPNLLKSIIVKVPILIVSAGTFSMIGLIYGLLTKTNFSSDNWQNRYFN